MRTIIAIAAVLALAACGKQDAAFNWQGLPLECQAIIDEARENRATVSNIMTARTAKNVAVDFVVPLAVAAGELSTGFAAVTPVAKAIKLDDATPRDRNYWLGHQYLHEGCPAKEARE